ncbi:MAG: hypothetical protein PWP23_903 [Candidatus Sumerlaeota bacterium]|nr:hypothetical protein [Candidatus Sumerlaeota bacterium]
MTQPSAIVELTPNVAMVPVLRGSVAFANEVRRGMLEWRPERLAVELPAALEEALRRMIDALPHLQVMAWKPNDEGTARFMAADPCDARIEAYRLGREFGLHVNAVDGVEAAAEETWAFHPDETAVEKTGAAAFARVWMQHVPAAPATARQKLMAGRIARLAATGQRTLVVADVGHVRALKELLADKNAADFEEETPGAVRLTVRTARPEWLPHLLGELPYLTFLYERFRPGADVGTPFPVAEALTRILDESATQYQEEYDEEVNLTEWRALYQFGRNLSLVRGRLRPRLYEVVTTAKSCVDDDFGAIVLEKATAYPPNTIDEENESREDASKLRSTHLYFDLGCGMERGAPAYPQPELSTLEFHFRRSRPSQRQKRAWQEQFGMGLGMCSWPPEDERIEKFFAFLRRKALAQISAEHTLVEEFSSSMQDGLDVRETMRNWHRGKLYVRRERTPPGKVGPVVLVWRDYPLEWPDIWKTTFYAEHQNESDISFYGTPLGQEMVGPQIARTEYHGILSVFPAAHIPDVWQVPVLYQWETHARLLLAAAILLCTEKYVAWVAPVPPDRDLVDFARANNVGIITLPLAGFSRKTLKRLRQVHVLGTKRAREWGADYIAD